jgi:hypothetical protein
MDLILVFFEQCGRPIASMPTWYRETNRLGAVEKKHREFYQTLQKKMGNCVNAKNNKQSPTNKSKLFIMQLASQYFIIELPISTLSGHFSWY